MIGFMNYCPHCGEKSSFVPEEMECDKSLVLWCQHCGDFINQTLTLETIRRWWLRYEAGEEAIHPPISKDSLHELIQIQEKLNTMEVHVLNKIEIHVKDFMDYHFTDMSDNND